MTVALDPYRYVDLCKGVAETVSSSLYPRETSFTLDLNTLDSRVAAAVESPIPTFAGTHGITVIRQAR